MNWAGRCHSSAPVMSSQCLTLGWLCCIARLCGQNFREAIQEPRQNLENP
ncbi:hypothetical protein [Wolbachia endosymbiont (group A) of Barypeithes pellucidus]